MDAADQLRNCLPFGQWVTKLLLEVYRDMFVYTPHGKPGPVKYEGKHSIR